jgi:shikimate kinase
MLKTTVGQLLVNEALPEDMRDYDRVLDGKMQKKLLQVVAEKHPDKYREVSKKLSDVGRDAAYSTGGYSFGLKHLQSTLAAKQMQLELRSEIQRILSDPKLSESERNDRVIHAAGMAKNKMLPRLLKELAETDNPLWRQVASGARSKQGEQFLSSLVGADLLYTDHRGNVLPVPVTRSYSQGLSPVEYFAGAYGARKGILDLKASTAKAGFLGKQLVAANHRLLVSALDDDRPYDEAMPRGMPIATDDPDNAGALLAHAVGGYNRNTELTPKILRDLKNKGVDEILVRSTTVGGPSDGGVYARDAGRRERGGIPPTGDFIGVAAAHALSAPITQAQICLAQGTLVRMADWTTKAIERVRPGDWILGADETGRTFPVQVLRCFDNGLRSCYRTFFRYPFRRDHSGVTLVSTVEHKILGIRYTSNCKADVFNGVPMQYPVGLRTRRLRAVLPIAFDDDARYVDEPMALLVGLVLGDGCYTDAANGVNFSCYDPSLIEDLKAELSPLNLKLTRLAGHTGYYRVSQLVQASAPRDSQGRIKEGYLNPIRRWLHDHEMLGKYAHEKELPAAIDSWNNRSIAALLGGLMVTDGSVFTPDCYADRAKPYLGFASTSLAMARKVRELLAWRFGVYATGPYHNNSGRKRTLYQIDITHEDGIRRCAAAIPLYGVKQRVLAEKLANWQVIRPHAYYKLLREEMAPVGLQQTYDLEVDHASHLFVLANGLIVSNSSKHTGGVAGAAEAGAIAGFKGIDALIQVPKHFPGGATHAQKDGRINHIREAPAGGSYVTIEGEDHYVPADRKLQVKVGDYAEAGDILSGGTPNPAEIVKHKGIGEGRRYFVDAFRKMLADSGVSAHRRNIELLARGLINHVRLAEEYGHWAPDDVVPYQTLEREWMPRPGHIIAPPKQAVGYYLERPVLQHTIGTKVQPSMLPAMERYGVTRIFAHRDPPPFAPEMIRGVANAAQDPDWMTRFLAGDQKKSLLKGVARGDVSDTSGTSYVPALAAGTEFGRTGATKGW